MEDSIAMMQALGFTWPSPAYILGLVVFGCAGIAAYYVGKRRGRPRTRWLGLALMLYPYLVWQTWLLWLVGAALCIGVWLDAR